MEKTEAEGKPAVRSERLLSGERTLDDLEKTQELFDFLQGRAPDGYKIKRDHMPKLTPDQAWTVIWYLGNLYWQVTDYIERCCVCGDLYHTHREGECLDYGKAPHHFCESCRDGEEYARKVKLNPDNASGELPRPNPKL